MKTIITTLLLAICTNTFGQNLVADSSFENILTCPSNFGQIYYPPFPPAWPQTLSTWYSAVQNSPDYYNSCSVDIYSTVPNNYYGHYPARTGEAYVGLVAYSGLLTNAATSYREYVGCELTQPLVAGQKYKVSMWVYFVVHPYISTGFAAAATDRIGAHFSANAVYGSLPPLTNSFVSLQAQTPSFLDDSSQWVNITAEYTATGGEQFLTLGTFYNGSLPALQPFFPTVPAPADVYLSYYFIDDVTVTEAPVIPCDTTIVKHDTLLCSYYPLLLAPASTSNSYTWNTGASTPAITVSTSGIYWRIATNGCDALIDTFHVKFFNSTTTVTHDVRLCASESTITLQAQPATIYNWNTGATTASIAVNTSGTYFCTALSGCDLFTDTFHVAGYNTTNYTHDSSLCFPANVTISGIPDADRYEWSNGQTTAGISISHPGVYTCSAYKDCDLFISQFKITDKSRLNSISLGSDATICAEQKTTIGANYPDAVSYLWNTGETSCCITPQKTGTYILQVDNSCTILQDTIDLELVACEDCIFIPSAFTPNSDGKNDAINAIAKCPLLSFDITIANRFGEIVYHSSDITQKWNGYHKGRPCDLGVYYYIIQYTSAGNGKEHTLKGDITLIY